MSPNAAFRVGFRNLLCVKRGTFEMEKGTNGYLLLVVLWFLREGMSRYMAYIAQKGGIMTVLLSKGFLIFILL